jgi:hypothetical protein
MSTLCQAAADYQTAVERYLALVSSKNSSAMNVSVSLQQLDEAKEAVERCREYYYSVESLIARASL